MKKVFRVGTAFASALTLAGLVGTGMATGTAATALPSAPQTARLAAYAAPAYTAPSRVLKVGMSGSDVKALQQRLNALHYYAGSADGQFGSNTEEAVWAFQEVQGIGVDGQVGPTTAHYLQYPKSPALRDAYHQPNRVEVNLTKRFLVLVRNHNIILISHISPGGHYWYKCSSGGGSCYANTPTGTFHTTRYMSGWVTVPLGKMYNPVFFIGTSYAIHGDTSVPLNPASHGCVRIPMDIASWFHNDVWEPGFPVFIYN